MESFFLGMEKIKSFNDLLEFIDGKDQYFCEVMGLVPTQRAHFSLSLLNKLNKKIVYIAPNGLQAQKVYNDFCFFCKDEVILFPDTDVVLHSVSAESKQIYFDKLEALYKIFVGDYKVLVLSAESLLSKIMSPERFEQVLFTIKLGMKLNLVEFSQKLVYCGYERCDLVEAKGQFAFRGGIIDVFLVNSENPIRIELFDDEVDSIRYFDVESQRSLASADECVIVPARELLYFPKEQDEIIKRMELSLDASYRRFTSDEIKVKENLESIVKADIERLETGYYFAGMQKYLFAIPESNSNVLDYLDSDNLLFIDEVQRFDSKIDASLLEYGENVADMVKKGNVLVDSKDTLLDKIDLLDKLFSKKVLSLNTFCDNIEGLFNEKRFEIQGKSVVGYNGKLEVFFDDVKFHLKKGKSVVLICGSETKCRRMLEVLKDEEIAAEYYHDFDFKVKPNVVSLTHGTLNQGFEYIESKFIVIADKELFGEDRKNTKRKFDPAKSEKIKVFADISPGDYVVHYSHGIGQYVGIDKLKVGDSQADYLKIKYFDADFLYVPVSQLDLVQKYIGGGDKNPKLNRLGSAEWTKAKRKVKESLKDIASDLIEIYAKREMARGHSFAKDTIWQKNMEDAFEFEETVDQLRCIDEIKQNMEAVTPMDRLLCGDVGFGKTEVALRAIFKAVMDSKQVAYLVPTTVLAHQHFMNFKERLKDFPVKVEMLSRFKTPKEQQAIIKDVKKGMVDVVIGTHRLVQKDILFKDLGLLVVDEEQRFGVTHKEKLKKLKSNVDCLTLTATPIPRTLHMSLVGIRDISVIEQPPLDRHPVQTYVLEYNEDVIREAVEREMARGGQVFYLFNSIRAIELKLNQIHAIVPEARIQIAHGQMSKDRLEVVMQDFLDRKFDVLLCSTIIESGLDYPNVNTIIVEDADKLGLSQMYQIRGRVGRSNRVAYAYLTFRRDKVLSEVAQKRLMAIREFTELGSGFKIAMRDLEIRGAGNILGSQQHGQMDTVGYDMYMRLLNEAVTELRGSDDQTSALDIEINIDMGVDAYISSDYIKNEIHKLNMYKKVASIETNEDYEELLDEFIDRFGDVPSQTRNLMDVSFIRVMSKGKSIESIIRRGQNIDIQFEEGIKLDFEILSKLMEKYNKKIMFNASKKPYITYKIVGDSKSKMLQEIKVLLQDINKYKIG